MRLPVEEKYGMIFAGMPPDVKVSVDEILGHMAPVFERWELGATHFVALHKNTLGGISIGNTRRTTGFRSTS